MRSPESSFFHHHSRQELPSSQATLVLGEPYLVQESPSVRYNEGRVLLTYGLQVKTVQEALSFRGKKHKVYPLHISPSREKTSQLISRIHALAKAQGNETSAPSSLDELPVFLVHQQHQRSIDSKTSKEAISPILTEDTLRILFDSRTAAKLPEQRSSRLLHQGSPFTQSVTRLADQVTREKEVSDRINGRKEKKQLGEIENNEARIEVVVDHFIDYSRSDQLRGETQKNKKAKLRKLYTTFGLSEFSFKTLVGTHGQLVIPEFLDNLQLTINLHPTSNDRKALLALAAVTSEEEFPVVHKLLQLIAEYDIQPKKTSNSKSHKRTPVEAFFAQSKRQLSSEKQEQIKKGRKQFTDQFANNLRKKRQDLSGNSRQMLEGMLAFHDVEIPKNIEKFVAQIASKPLTELQHDEIAFILSAQMERTTASQKLAVTDKFGQLIEDLTKQLNEYGHYFFNMDFSEYHDKDTYHGVVITLPDGSVHFDLCLTHTPPIDLQLANLSFELSIPSAPSFSTTAFSGIAESLGGVGFSQGIPLFAQAFASGGVSLGAVFSGSAGLRGVHFDSSVVKLRTTKTLQKKDEQKTQEVVKKKPISHVVFNASGRSSGDRKSKQLRFSKVVPSIAPRPKECDDKVPTTRKSIPPEPIPISSLSKPKHREFPIFIVSSESAPKISLPIVAERKAVPPIVTKPKEKRKPRIISEAQIASRSGNDRRGSYSTTNGLIRKESVINSLVKINHRRSETPVVKTSTEFSKQLNQVFQKKRELNVAVKATKAKPTHSVQVLTQSHQLVDLRKVHKKVREASKKEVKSIFIARKKGIKKVARAEQVKSDTKEKTQKHINLPAKADSVVRHTQVINEIALKEKSAVTKTGNASTTAIPENLTTVVTALVGGTFLMAAKRFAPLLSQEKVVFSTKIVEQGKKLPIVDMKSSFVNKLLTRRRVEYGTRGGGGLPPKSKTVTKVPVQTTDRVSTAIMRSLPANAMIDVSDSFNTAREVKMWAQEALAHPKLIERYYATAT